MRRCVFLFLLLLGIYNSNLRPVAAGDSLPASLTPLAIVLDGTVTLDRFGSYISEHVPYASSVVHREGAHWYSTYPIAGPLMASPVYLPVAFVPWFRKQSPATLIAVARVMEKLVASALAALTAVWLLLLLRRITSESAAWGLTLVFALGTANWSTSSQALWQHTFGGLVITGCLYCVSRWADGPRWYWLAGLCAGWAVAIRPTNVALLPALAIAVWVEKGRTAAYARVLAFPVLAGALAASYNYAAFGHVSGGYPSGLNGNLITGLAGILFSPGRGLLMYSPVVVFALTVLGPEARKSRTKHAAVASAAGAFAVVQIGLIAMWPVWWGGYCWGPRLLSEICVPAMVLIAVGMPEIVVRRWSRGLAAVALYGCLIQAIGVYCYPKGHWDHLPVSVNEAPNRLWEWRDNPVARTVRGGVAWEPYAILGAGVRGGAPAAAQKLRELGINSF